MRGRLKKAIGEYKSLEEINEEIEKLLQIKAKQDAERIPDAFSDTDEESELEIEESDEESDEERDDIGIELQDALYEAIRRNRIEIVKLLIDKCANDLNLDEALIETVRFSNERSYLDPQCGAEEIAKLLIDKGARSLNSALYMVLRNDGDTRMADMLIAKGANIDFDLEYGCGDEDTKSLIQLIINLRERRLIKVLTGKSYFSDSEIQLVANKISDLSLTGQIQTLDRAINMCFKKGSDLIFRRLEREPDPSKDVGDVSSVDGNHIVASLIKELVLGSDKDQAQLKKPLSHGMTNPQIYQVLLTDLKRELKQLSREPQAEIPKTI